MAVFFSNAISCWRSYEASSPKRPSRIASAKSFGPRYLGKWIDRLPVVDLRYSGRVPPFEWSSGGYSIPRKNRMQHMFMTYTLLAGSELCLHCDCVGLVKSIDRVPEPSSRTGTGKLTHGLDLDQIRKTFDPSSGVLAYS